MAITSVSGTAVHMTKAAAAPLVLTPTGITKAAPAVVTVADTTGMADGDIVVMTATDYLTLDNKGWIVAGLTGTTFELLGSDTTGEAAALAGSPVATAYRTADVQDMTQVLSAFDPSPGTPNEVDISTFANPGGTLPGIAQTGSVAFTGFTDIADSGYDELRLAEADAAIRWVRISPPSQGHFLYQITVGSFAPTHPLEGSSGFTFTATLNQAPVHRYA